MKKLSLLLVIAFITGCENQKFNFSAYEWIPITQVFDRAIVHNPPNASVALTEEEFQSFSDRIFDYRLIETTRQYLTFLIDEGEPKVKVIALRFHYVCPLIPPSETDDDWFFGVEYYQKGGVGILMDSGFVINEKNALGYYEFFFPDWFVKEDYHPEGGEEPIDKNDSLELTFVTVFPRDFVDNFAYNCRYDEIYVKIQ